MGWVNEAGSLNPDAIKGDLTGLESGTKDEFDGNIDKCASWNGDFGSRRKREAGGTETEEEVSNVPSVMASGSSALGWLKAAVRKTRGADPGDKNGKKRRNNKPKGRKKKQGKKVGKNGNGRRKGKGRRNNKPKGRKKKQGKKVGKNGNGRRKGKGRRNNKPKGRKKKQGKKVGKNGNGRRKGKGTNRNDSKGKKGKKNKGKNAGSENKKASRNNKDMDDSTYNKLWCFDLSLEQILEKCVENKIKN